MSGKTARPHRLTRDRIVAAAVDIAARGRPDGLTGRALGEELGVDRSAVWRHFADKDTLLRAVGDRLLSLAYHRVPAGLEPKPRLEALARAVVAVFVGHPYVGAAIASRTTRGPGEFAVVDMMLTALAELGLSPDDVVRYQRMLAVSVLSYAGVSASYAVLPQKVRDADERSWTREYYAVDAEQYPGIAEYATRLAAVGPDLVLDTMIEAFWTAVDARIPSNTNERNNSDD
ncbi:TetR/AcrR family transcriptional regulator [Nocardia lijiangensis]|uniref:TetR/AcrR family transcriptional regulator n=1 Tax=Nocardia lijiangensis TaxID=299618 RepID=UPI00082C6903|nr:TetR family transcriptional regulator [Nocardia lijiangensis]